MTLRTRIYAVLTAGLVGAGLLAAGPASADVLDPTITAVRTGSNPVVAGSEKGTSFTVTITNPNEVDLEADISGYVDDNLYLQDVSGEGLSCDFHATSYTCLTGGVTAPSGASIGASILPAGASYTYTVEAKAAHPFTPVGTYDLCSYMIWDVAPPLDAPSQPDACSGQIVAPRATGFLTSATASVDVVREVDLTLSATQPAQTDPGAQAQTTFTVQDNGPSGLTEVTLNGTLDPATTFVSSEGSDWTCVVDGQQFTCTNPYVNCFRQRSCGPSRIQYAIQPLTVTFGTAKPGVVQDYRIPANVVPFDATDPTPDDARVDVVIPVTPVTLEVMKASEPTRFRIGQRKRWTVSVANTGAIDDTGALTVVDTMSKGLKYVSAAGDDWTCAVSGQTITCTKPDGLAKGDTSEFVVVTKLTQAGRVTNEAEIFSTSFMSNMSVIRSSVIVPVLRLRQTAKPLPATPARIVSGKTDQGRKIYTRVRCRPVASANSGEVNYCRLSRRDGVVRVDVIGDQKTVVRVTQTARGTNRYRPFLQSKTYVVNP